MDNDKGKDIITLKIQVIDQIKMAGEKDIAMKLLKLLNCIAIADPTVNAKSYFDGTEWMNDKLFPTGDAFMKESSICQQTSTQGYTTMVAYFQIVREKQWFQIKTLTVVMNHLKKYNTWVYMDEFEMRRVRSPGFLTELHPKLTNLAALTFGLEQMM
eukprot:1469522-Ditylum_brightwellii.AAC.1